MKGTRGIATLLLLAVLAPAGEPDKAAEVFHWPQRLGGPTHDAYRERIDRITRPVLLWHRPELRGEPTLSGGRLFSGGPFLAAVDPATGKIVHRRDVRGVTFMAAPALDGKGVVAVRSDLRVEALDWTLTKERWWFQAHNQPAGTRMTSATLAGDRVLVAYGKTVAAHDAQTPGPIWEFDAADGDVHTTPAFDGKRVYVATRDGTIYALDARTGRLLWRSRSKRREYGAFEPIVRGERLYLGYVGAGKEDTCGLVCHEVGEGWPKWTTHSAREVAPTPVLDATRIFYSIGSHLKHRPLADGGKSGEDYKTRTWGRTALAVVADHLYAAGDEGSLYCFRVGAPDFLWKAKLPGDGVLVDAIVHSGVRIFLATNKGLFALGQDPTNPEPPAKKSTITLRE